MAGSVLVRDVLWRASVLLGDNAPQFERWPCAEMIRWLNDGQRAIAKYLPSAGSRVDALRLAPGTKQSIEAIASGAIVPGDGSAPVAVRGNMLMSVSRNMGTDGATPGRAIRLVDRDMLDTLTPDWHTTAGSPPAEYVFDPRLPKVFYVNPPVPGAGTWWAEVIYLADPVALLETDTYAFSGANDSKISVADVFADDLTNYIVARGQMKDAEFSVSMQSAGAFATMFINSINAQATAATGVNPNLEWLPFAPGAPAAAR